MGKNDGSKHQQQKEKQQKEHKGPSLMEWVSAAIGGAITLGLLALIAVEAIGPSTGFPAITIHPTAFARTQGSYAVQVDVRNDSGETASGLQIEGELLEGGKAVETSQATISYVPGYSSRRAGLIFSKDPRQYQLQIRATGYELP